MSLKFQSTINDIPDKIRNTTRSTSSSSSSVQHDNVSLHQVPVSFIFSGSFYSNWADLDSVLASFTSLKTLKML